MAHPMQYVACIWTPRIAPSDFHTQISTPTANFLSGGLASFVYWIMAIPADNIKKSVYLLCVSYWHPCLHAIVQAA